VKYLRKRRLRIRRPDWKQWCSCERERSVGSRALISHEVTYWVSDRLDIVTILIFSGRKRPRRTEHCIFIFSYRWSRLAPKVNSNDTNTRILTDRYSRYCDSLIRRRPQDWQREKSLMRHFIGSHNEWKLQTYNSQAGNEFISRQSRCFDWSKNVGNNLFSSSFLTKSLQWSSLWLLWKGSFFSSSFSWHSSSLIK
jgi:hypothetical protein